MKEVFCIASNHTPNYNLNQWQATDQVKRTEFNEDNAKIDTALSAASARADFLEAAAVNLAYHAGYAALQNYVATHKTMAGRSLPCDDFSNPTIYTITGDAVVASGMLTLTGMGKTATATTTSKFSLGVFRWHKALLWVRYSCATVDASINGKPMKLVQGTSGYSPAQNKHTFEQLFALDAPEGDHSGQVSLHLTCGRCLRLVRLLYLSIKKARGLFASRRSVHSISQQE